MLYVQLDVNWPDNHKIIDVGIEGAGLHAIVLCLAKRQETDGWVRRRLLHRQGASDDLIQRVIDVGLLDTEEDRVRPHDWFDRNPSQAAIDATKALKAEAGKRGNHTKWHHDGTFEACPKCHPESLVIAECDRVRSGATRSSTITRGIAEVTSAIPAAIVDPNVQGLAARALARSEQPPLTLVTESAS